MFSLSILNPEQTVRWSDPSHTYPAAGRARAPVQPISCMRVIQQPAVLRRMLHSARRDKRHQAPFYLLANVDIWVNRMEGPKTLGVMTDPRFYCRDRRPYWAALASQLGEGSIGIKNLLESVRAKLLGGLPSFAARELEQLLKRAVEALLFSVSARAWIWCRSASSARTSLHSTYGRFTASQQAAMPL